MKTITNIKVIIMIGEAFNVLKEYEDYENRDKRLNKGHIQQNYFQTFYLRYTNFLLLSIYPLGGKIRRFLNG